MLQIQLMFYVNPILHQTSLVCYVNRVLSLYRDYRIDKAALNSMGALSGY